MALMINAYLLQWIWVVLIVVAAVIFAVRAVRLSCRHTASRKGCSGCALAEECESSGRKAGDEQCRDKVCEYNDGCGCH